MCTTKDGQVQENLADELPSGVSVCALDVARTGFILVPGKALTGSRHGSCLTSVKFIHLIVDCCLCGRRWKGGLV